MESSGQQRLGLFVRVCFGCALCTRDVAMMNTGLAGRLCSLSAGGCERLKHVCPLFRRGRISALRPPSFRRSLERQGQNRR